MDVKTRKRGVKASRVKLDAAMLNAGIKNQTSLAILIANNEDLDDPPKDTINRAFRQKKVSPTTIARIAKALEVEAYTLYLSKQENDLLQDNGLLVEEKTVEPNKSSLNYLTKRSLLLIGFIVSLFIYWQSQTNTFDSLNRFNQLSSQQILGQHSLVLYSYDTKTDALASALKEKLQQDFKVVEINRVLLSSHSGPVEIAQDYQADGVLTIRNQLVGRFMGVQIYLYFNSQEKLIWTDSFALTEITQQNSEISQNVLPFLKQAMGYSSAGDQSQLGFVDLANQTKYLKARNLLDNFQSELNVKRAQTFLHSAIEVYPKFSRALAALCETFIYDSWREDEKARLEDAQFNCDKARLLSPNVPYINTTNAYLYRRSGRIIKSINLYHRVLESYPNNIEALSGLSSAYLEAYRQNLSEYPDAAKKMVNYALKTTTIEPDYWQNYASLGLLNYYAGNTKNAAIAYEVAANLNPNELAYTNVGTLHKCQGDLEKAKIYYAKAQRLAPNSYLGDDYLGSIYFYNGEFRLAAESKKKALDSLTDKETGGLHQMWGELGDAYRKDDQISNSVDSYKNAIKILKRDALRGNVAIADEIHHFYYLLILTTLDSERYSKKVFNLKVDQLKQFLASDVDPAANATLARSFYLLGELTLAKQALQKATSVCPVYNKHPDLKTLLNSESQHQSISLTLR